MLSIPRKLEGPWLVAALAAGLLCMPPASSATGAGRVVGHIDGISQDGEQFFISGWACQQGNHDSIAVHVYADHSAYDTPRGTFVLAGKADLESEPAVNQACQDRVGAKHRFEIALPTELLTTYEGRPLYVHGIRVVGSVPNAAITGAGVMHFPKPLDLRTARDAYPQLLGTYTSSTKHPRVFTTQNELSDLVTRINSPGSFSAQNFARLADRAKGDIAAKIDWDATYSGCDIDIYLHAFSYEPTGGYADEIRTEAQLHSAMRVQPGLAFPAGAAIVAARVALYAALVRAGAYAAPGSPAPDQAVAFAKRILLAWASRGFRDRTGSILTAAAQFCDGQGHFTHASENAVGLHVSRGVVYSVDAQDLLQSIQAFSPAEAATLTAFHAAMFDLIREASNFRAALPEMTGPDSACERYSNHVGAHLIGLLAIARLLDDGRRFNAVLYGTDPSIPVAIPWTQYFDHAVYGEHDRPNPCHRNSGADSLTSHPSYQTDVVAPGEIEDRYRNANDLQGFGYTLGVLGALFNMADVMRNAGIDAFGYRGRHHQSIEMAVQYYACYGRYVGFKKTVTADNARACPDYQQYVGQRVNGLEAVIVMGTDRFPRNAVVTELEEAAKAESLRNPVNAMHFGRWTN